MYIKKCFSKFIGEDNKCKSIIQKVLSVGASFSLMFGMVPSSVVSADEPGSFLTRAHANHWGRSDLRAYLNNGTKGDLDMSGSGNGDNYPKYFSDEEYDLVKPHTYSTNEFANLDETVTCVHETTDKFWLPSVNFRKAPVLSWGSEDISEDSQYTASTQKDKQRLIPRSYWSHGSSYKAWARSPGYHVRNSALVASRGYRVYNNYVYDNLAVAAAFKIPLTSVIFSSAASAASHAGVVGGSEIRIAGSDKFGRRVRDGDALPNYGMYLKKESTHTFTPSDLSFSNNTLTVNYSGGVTDQCVMVQAFKSDDLTNGTKSYVVGKSLASESGTLDIDVSKWNLDSLDGYIIKVWMEDASGGSSLAPATKPVTFIGNDAWGDGFIVASEEGETKNLRVFAMKEDLKCSWGTLRNRWDLSGEGATNQKIYFGSNNGTPLEFWIAGREDSTNNYQIDPSGDIMTLYQAFDAENRKFNEAITDYKGNGSRVTLQLGGNAEFKYTETEPTIKYTGSITAKVVNSKSKEEIDITTRDLIWQFRTPGSGTWHTGMPIDNGDYELRCYVMGVSSKLFEFERTCSAVCAFKVSGVPASGSAADG